MSCANSAPSSSSISLYTSASEFLGETGGFLHQREREANILLPHALKYQSFEATKGTGKASVVPPNRNRALSESTDTSSSESTFPEYQIHKNFWLATWSQKSTGKSSDTRSLDFALSCLESYLGTLPIFIYSQKPTSQLDTAFLHTRMRQLAKRLSLIVPPSRVFSVFG